jgi:hypothetical protein
LHERLIGRVDARQLDAMPRAERRLRVREEALSLLREQGHMLPQSALADVVNAVSDAVVGMGPIEFLLKDPKHAQRDTFEQVDNITRCAYLGRAGRQHTALIGIGSTPRALEETRGAESRSSSGGELR